MLAIDAEGEAQGLRRQEAGWFDGGRRLYEWRRGYKAVPPLCLNSEGFWETVPAIRAAPNSPTWFNGPQPGLSRNHSPRHSFIAAVCCYSPNNRRFLHNLSRLSNRYCTTITPIFSPRFDFSDIFA